MERIPFVCAKCRALVHVRYQLIGKEVRCPNCGRWEELLPPEMVDRDEEEEDLQEFEPRVRAARINAAVAAVAVAPLTLLVGFSTNWEFFPGRLLTWLLWLSAAGAFVSVVYGVSLLAHPTIKSRVRSRTEPWERCPKCGQSDFQLLHTRIDGGSDRRYRHNPWMCAKCGWIDYY